MLVSSSRSDAVYHAVRKCPVLLEPISQLRITQLDESEQHLLCYLPIALQVVTRHDGKRYEFPIPASLQCFREVAEGAFGLVWMSQVMLNVRVFCIKFARSLMHIIATLGDREGDNRGIRRRQLF